MLQIYGNANAALNGSEKKTCSDQHQLCSRSTLCHWHCQFCRSTPVLLFSCVADLHRYQFSPSLSLHTHTHSHTHTHTILSNLQHIYLTLSSAVVSLSNSVNSLKHHNQKQHGGKYRLSNSVNSFQHHNQKQHGGKYRLSNSVNSFQHHNQNSADGGRLSNGVKSFQRHNQNSTEGGALFFQSHTKTPPKTISQVFDTITNITPFSSSPPPPKPVP